ncbi:glycosyltransferase, partial [bacterium]|nr:glycosyltransferase [bacterium]
MIAPATVAIALLVLASNVWFWIRALRGYLTWRRAATAPDPPRWPRAHVFVCLKGELPRISETVGALASQDYAGPYRITFVTEASAERGDAAAAGLAALLSRSAGCDHVVAGRVVESGARCAQKNFNLLAGIRHAEEVHPGAEVFAFCDGDLLVTPSWLAEMVRPVASGGYEASTSFHWVGGEGRRIIEALHGLAEACQSMAALVCRGATWGGSMAIRAAVFRKERLAEEWGRTVVDDMALSRALKNRRLRVAAVPRFLVRTESEITSFGAFVRWLGRQYFFVKVYQPSLYHLLWIRTALDVANLWLAAYHLGHRLAAGAWPAGPE